MALEVQDRVPAWLKFSDICCDEVSKKELTEKDCHALLKLLGNRQMTSSHLVISTMKNLGMAISEGTYRIILVSHSKEKNFKEIKNTILEMKEDGIKITTMTYNVILSMYFENSLNDALVILSQMQQEGILLDQETYNILIRGCAKKNNLDLSQKFFIAMKEAGFTPDIVTYTEMIQLYCLSNKIEDAVQVFEQCVKLELVDKFVFSTIIIALIRNSRLDKVEQIWAFMIESQITPDLYLYTNYIKYLFAAKQPEKVTSILQEMSRNGVYPDDFLIQLILDGYADAGDVNSAYELFRETSLKGHRLTMGMYRTALEISSQARDEDKVYVIYDLMKGMKLSAPIYNTVLKTAKESFNLEVFRSVWKDLLKDGNCSPNEVSFMHALEMHTLLKNIDEAKAICHEMLAHKMYLPIEQTLILIQCTIQARRYIDAAEIINWIRKSPSGKGKDLSALLSPHLDGFKDLVGRLSQKTFVNPEEQRKRDLMVIDIYLEVFQKASLHDEKIYRLVMDAYSNVKNLVGVVRIWSTLETQFPNPLPESLESLLKASLKLGQEKTALAIIKMVNESEKLTLNRVGYECMLGLAAKFTDGRSLPSLVLDMMNSDIPVDGKTWLLIRKTFIERKIREGSMGSSVPGDEAYKYVLDFINENFPQLLIEPEDEESQ